MESRIITKNLSFAYKTKQIINNVNLRIEPGQVLVILGPNGIGKSTLLNCLSGVLTQYNGQICVNGDDLKTMTIKDLSHQLALVSQGVNIKSNLTLFDYLLLGRTSFHTIFEQPDDTDKRIVEDIIEEIGLNDYAQTSLQSMSGGQRQLAIIGRALAQEPQVLIMDEPTSALDYRNQTVVLKLIRRLSSKGISIIMSTHDPNQAQIIGDLVGLLIDNQTYLQGVTKQILNDDNLSELYGTSISSTYNESLDRKIFGIGMD
ncbi:ABC transporter ATP-binding protein [Companilactobacillus hulinensis]|uniref:ABC transporter ATP-binding protein n=1 Tax=Companilactobacillus hulinensis TaxID=2486007 RepID=UPI0013DE7906|nr:ABC transporter ATP-binding protein [Companilactobacillus hulinensis]